MLNIIVGMIGIALPPPPTLSRVWMGKWAMMVLPSKQYYPFPIVPLYLVEPLPTNMTIQYLIVFIEW